MRSLQKRKGAAGERELAKLLSEHLGISISRNLGQARDGGADIDIPGWSIEVKRAAKLNHGTWWTQALQSARKTGKRPVLAYRLDRYEWRFVIRLSDILADCREQSDYLTAELSLDGFSLLIRENF